MPTRFMTSPNAMRDMAGRFDVHAQAVEDDYQFGDVDAHGATIRAQAASLETEHQAIIRGWQPSPVSISRPTLEAA